MTYEEVRAHGSAGYGRIGDEWVSAIATRMDEQVAAGTLPAPALWAPEEIAAVTAAVADPALPAYRPDDRPWWEVMGVDPTPYQIASNEKWLADKRRLAEEKFLVLPDAEEPPLEGLSPEERTAQAADALGPEPWLEKWMRVHNVEPEQISDEELERLFHLYEQHGDVT
jgi:hypothetical protein